MRRMMIGAMALALPLAGCGSKETAAPAQSDPTAPTASGATRTEVAPPEAPEPGVATMAQPVVIQSQPGPDGSQVDLLKAAVTGDILTVTLRCSSDKDINTESFKLDDVSVIDDATSQRIAVLKDNAGKWLASRVAGANMMASCEKRPGVIWAKFPAPPATSKTVSINFPETAPFDGVPVTR